MSEKETSAEENEDLWTPLEGRLPARHNAAGPLDSAIREMRLASELFAIEQLRRRRLTRLLERSDLLLAGLEELNLLDLKRVPERGLSQLEALVAEVPFEYRLPIGPRPSPTAAIDAVFDLQAGILQTMTGVEAEADEPLERVS
jgi:hypothetical protein